MFSRDCDKNLFSGECSNVFIIGYLIETTTSKVGITLPQKTRMAREMGMVVADGPGVARSP
jgi:co-chaperonin GroES (HSP10)